MVAMRVLQQMRMHQILEAIYYTGISVKPVLVEVYRTAEDPGKHKETAHYAKWRDTVAEMMTEPRSSLKYANIFPDDEGWG